MRTPVEFELRGHKFSGGAGHHIDGEIGEVFLSSGKTGQFMSIIVSDAAVAVSLALQHGCTIDTLRQALLREEDGKAAGPLGMMLDILAGEKK